MNESKIICGKRTELWRGLVRHGVRLSGKGLPEELEYYLTALFDTTFELKDGQRSFLDGSIVMMLSDAHGKEGLMRRDALRFAGNACLMRAGFNGFVSRTFNRMCGNPIQYYMDVGATAFMTLWTDYKNSKQRQQGEMYRSVAVNLPSLVEVLSRIEKNEKVAENLHRLSVGNVTYL